MASHSHSHSHSHFPLPLLSPRLIIGPSTVLFFRPFPALVVPYIVSLQKHVATTVLQYSTTVQVYDYGFEQVDTWNNSRWSFISSWPGSAGHAMPRHATPSISSQARQGRPCLHAGKMVLTAPADLHIGSGTASRQCRTSIILHRH